jgi:hypothetical protein
MVQLSKISLFAFCSRVLPVQSDCGWTSTCGPRGCPDCKDDGSAGYRECCGGSGPSPSPGPPAPGDAYCPNQGDFGSDGNVQWHGNGWTIQGSGGVHSKTTWNLNGGFVEFDMDTSGAQGGVNTNLYTTSPDQVQPRNECDIQGEGKPSCMEMDIIEMNGNCMAQSTVHTWPNHNGGCDKGGCASLMRASGKFHVKAEFSPGGWMTVLINGQKNEHYNPSPSKQSQDNVVQNMNSKGAQIQSSQWVGWVPGGNQCPGGGNLGGSRFTVSNLVVKGSVVQGPQPTKCSGSNFLRSNTTFVV